MKLIRCIAARCCCLSFCNSYKRNKTSDPVAKRSNMEGNRSQKSKDVNVTLFMSKAPGWKARVAGSISGGDIYFHFESVLPMQIKSSIIIQDLFIYSTEV